MLEELEKIVVRSLFYLGTELSYKNTLIRELGLMLKLSFSEGKGDSEIEWGLSPRCSS